MTLRLTTEARALLAAPFANIDRIADLGRSLWLYVFLVTAATDLGFIVKSRAGLARSLAVSEDTIDLWLGRLVDARLIRVVAPAPYLVISLPLWSGKSAPSEKNPSSSSGAAPSALDKGPVYSHSTAGSMALEKESGDRGLGKGESLRAELRVILPDAEPAEIERILQHYPATTVAKTIDRVNRTPATRIRKSKVALFRYLLGKFSQEIDVDEL